MKKSMFVFMALVLLLNSCSNKNHNAAHKKSDVTFDNTRWKMVKIRGLDPFPKLEKDAFIQFDKTTNRFRGNTGCNNFTGGYAFKNGKLSLSPAAMTKMFCVGDGMKVEDLFSKMIDTIDSYVIKGDHLELKSGNFVVAEFEAVFL